MRPLLVGEAPGVRVEGGEPLTGQIGTRIANLLDVTEREYMDMYDRVNLFDFEIVGRWPWFEARHSAVELRDTFAPGLRVVLLGVRVADAFSLIQAPLYSWCPMPAATMVQAVRVPHPSGRNRLLNEERHREMFRAILVGALEW